MLIRRDKGRRKKTAAKPLQFKAVLGIIDSPRFTNNPVAKSLNEIFILAAKAKI